MNKITVVVSGKPSSGASLKHYRHLRRDLFNTQLYFHPKVIKGVKSMTHKGYITYSCA